MRSRRLAERTSALFAGSLRASRRGHAASAGVSRLHGGNGERTFSRGRDVLSSSIGKERYSLFFRKRLFRSCLSACVRKKRARWGHRVREGRVRTSSRRQACSPPESFLKAEFILPHETAAWTSAFRSIIKHFPFEMLRLSNHTACRFAEKHGFFRALSAGGAVRRSAFYLFQR